MPYKASKDLLAHPLAPYLALWHTPGVGPMHFFKIVGHLPDIRVLFESSAEHLRSIGLTRPIAEALQTPDWKSVGEDLIWAEQPNQHLISWQDKHYPKQLKAIADPPPFLFIKGDIHLLSTPQIAIVGSRKPTPSGVESARAFTRALSTAGLTITSGLALGIDGVSHQSALDCDGKTIAILGTGIERVYPFRHRNLAAQVIEKGGALVSALPLDTQPKAENFPRRNRIISGLSLGTLVIEAALRSGSLITARLANEQGREVFAIPGSVHSPQSKGCHHLIQQGAKLTQTPEDVLEELQHPNAPPSSLQPHHSPGAKISLEADSQVLLEYIGFENTSVDQLIERTGFTAQTVSALASQLELKGLITALPGGYFKITYT